MNKALLEPEGGFVECDRFGHISYINYCVSEFHQMIISHANMLVLNKSDLVGRDARQ